MAKNDYEQRIAAMSAVELRDCLLCIVTAFAEVRFAILPYYCLDRRITTILNEWNLNPETEEE